MKWLTAENPEVGYLITEITEERLDGIPKISTPFVGMYSVLEPETIHVVIPKNNYENHHEVFKNIPDAKEFIQNHVLSRPPQ